MMKAALDISTLKITAERGLEAIQAVVFETSLPDPMARMASVGIAMSPTHTSKLATHRQQAAQGLPEGRFRNFANNASAGSVQRYMGMFGV